MTRQLSIRLLRVPCCSALATFMMRQMLGTVRLAGREFRTHAGGARDALCRHTVTLRSTEAYRGGAAMFSLLSL